MAPSTKQSSPLQSSPKVMQLTEAMTLYYVAFEKCSARVRNLPNREQLYEMAVENWKKEPFRRPKNEEEIDKLFLDLDEICKMEPQQPEE
jgi:hypothetical protein